MISILSKIFIKDANDFTSPAIRRAYGTLCSIVGIFLNVLMFAGKFIAGNIANSVSITADAFNNLSDAGSSIITLLGFRLAGKKPDPDHPFGHGRIEYLSGLAVSVLILVMGFELMKSSVTKLIHPEPVEASLLAGGIMVAAILIKLYMAFYNKTIGKKIDSAAMAAVAADSLSDTISTVVVLISMILSKFIDFPIDAVAGIFVAILILKTGFESVRDTVAPLLGQAPDPEFVRRIEEITMESTHIVGIHDLIVRDYGPGRVFISLHAEVPGNEDVFILHDEIDNAEFRLKERLGCEATIHLDPVDVDNEHVAVMKERVAEILKGYDETLTFHDFRMVPGETHTNLIFDVVVPAKYAKSNSTVNTELRELIHKECEDCFAVITVEQSYV
ncbi:MAG: cation diffusion facilitator family transporter [Clostridia bacterium]|nr:cation diffusion facilitator family transporter [Clostridia bacterium]